MSKTVCLALAILCSASTEVFAQTVVTVATITGAPASNSIQGQNWSAQYAAGDTLLALAYSSTVSTGGGMFAPAVSCTLDSGTCFQDAASNYWQRQYTTLNSSYFDTLADADTAATALKQTLCIDKSWTLTAALMPATSLWQACGGVITLNGYELEMSQFPFIPSGVQLFAPSPDTGSLLIAAGGRLSPSAFGAIACPVNSAMNGDPCSTSPSDSTNAFTRLFAVVAANVEQAHYQIYIDGWYAIGAGTSASCGLSTPNNNYGWDMLGSGMDESGLVRNCTGGGNLLSITGTDATDARAILHEFSLRSTLSALPSGTAGAGLVFGAQLAGRVDLEDFSVFNQPGDAVEIYSSDRLNWRFGDVTGNTGAGINFTNNIGVADRIESVRFYANGSYCMESSAASVGGGEINLNNLECLHNNALTNNAYEISFANSDLATGSPIICDGCDIEAQNPPDTTYDEGAATLSGYGIVFKNGYIGQMNGTMLNLNTCIYCKVDNNVSRSTGNTAVTFTNGSSSISAGNLALSDGNIVTFTTSGTLPTGFSTTTPYYIKSFSAGSPNTITVSATAGGGAISAGSAGSGTQTLYAQPIYVATDCFSYQDQITLAPTGAISSGTYAPGYSPATGCTSSQPGYLNGAQNQIYFDGSQVPQKYQIAQTTTVTPASMQYFASGNILDVTGAGASFTLANPTGKLDTVTFTNGSNQIGATTPPPVAAWVNFTTTGGLPTGFSVGTYYCVVFSAATYFEVAATCGGTAISASSAGTGTQTANVSPTSSFGGTLEVDFTASGVALTLGSQWHPVGTISSSASSGQRLSCPFNYDASVAVYYLQQCGPQ